MLNLIFKDIILSKRKIISAFMICLTICLVINIVHSKVLTILYILMPLTSMFILVDDSSFYDYRYTVNVMFNSLPIRKKDVVIAKYIEAVVFFIIGVAITLICTNLFKINVTSNVASGMANIGLYNKLLGTKSIIESCAISSVLLIAIYFPAYFKCQYMKVRGIFLLVNIAIVALPIIFVKVVGSVSTYKILTYFSKEPKWIMTSATAIILFLILSISLNLSINFYEKRDL